MIEIINLSKKYGNNAILENVSCSLENQRIYALVGVNGIGKSTLLNAGYTTCQYRQRKSGG